MVRALVYLTVLTLLSGALLILDGPEAGEKRGMLSGHITEDTVYPEDTYTMSDHLYIDAGVRVEFEAGCEIKVGQFPTPLRIFVEGELILNGTQNKKVEIKSATVNPAAGQWYGIVFRLGSVGRITNSTIEHVQYGLHINFNTNVKVFKTLIENASVAGVYYSNFFNGVEMYAPRNIIFEETTFYHCEWGIIENGIETKIVDCEFKECNLGGLKVGHGTYPFSKGLKLMDNVFRENRECAVQFGEEGLATYGITDIYLERNQFIRREAYSDRFINSLVELNNVTLYRNKFFQCDVYRMIRMEAAKDITLDNNYFYGDPGERYHSFMILMNFENLKIINNRAYNGVEGTNAFYASNGNNATVEKNWFSTTDSRISSEFHNVSNLIYRDNHCHRGGSIRASESSPVLIDNNYMLGSSINIHSANVSRSKGEIRIHDNQIQEGSIYCGGNTYSTINDNILINCSCAIALGNMFTEEETFMVENNTILNSTDLDLEMNSNYRNVYHVSLKNTTFDPEKVEMNLNAQVNATWFMRLNVSDEIGNPLLSTVGIDNTSGEYSKEIEVEGRSGLVKSPRWKIGFDWRNSPNRASINYEDMICNMSFASGDRQWHTKTNWTGYIEMDVILDKDPTFNDPGVIHFDEDTRRIFDPSDHFEDLDDIEVSIVKTDGNLTFGEGFVQSSEDNWTGESRVTFSALDTFGNHTDGTISFVVDPVNDEPVIDTEIPDIEMDEDSVYVLELKEYGYDIDGDDLTWEATAAEEITLELNTTNWNLTIEPIPNWHGNTSITLSLSDGTVTVNDTVVVDVLSINDPPVLDVPEGWSVVVTKGTEYRLDLTPFVSDIDGDDIQFTLESDSQNVVISQGELIAEFPEDSQATLIMVTIMINDGKGGQDSKELLINLEEAGHGKEWNLISADVQNDDDGNWIVEAKGDPGMEVHFVVTLNGGIVESHLMSEESPGEYTLELDSDLFKGGKTYGYYFTNETDGSDLAPELSGEMTQPETKDDEGISWYMLAGIILSFLLILILLIFIMSRNRNRGDIEE